MTTHRTLWAHDDKDNYTVTVRGCARCGETHEDQIFKLFVRPVVDADGTTWTHWSTCPNTGDPILMYREKDPSGSG